MHHNFPYEVELLRIDRLIDWNNNSGYQLTNGIVSIGSGGLFGMGLNNTPIYFPEPQTDFIFAVFSNNYAFIGSVLFIIFISIFDIKLINLGKKSKGGINFYIIFHENHLQSIKKGHKNALLF